MNGDVADVATRRASCCHPAPHVLEPQRRRRRDRPRRRCSTSASATAGAAATRCATGRTSTRCSARSCASTRAVTASAPYTIPTDNPFVGQAGHAGRDLDVRPAQPVAVLVRPHDATTSGSATSARASTRRSTTRPRAGAASTGAGTCARASTRTTAARSPPGAHDPIFERVARRRLVRDHRRLRVPRQRDRPASVGAYVFGDLCRSELSTVVQSGGTVTAQAEFPVGLSQPTTFGEDPDGELWVADLGGTVSKLVPPATTDGVRRRQGDPRGRQRHRVGDVPGHAVGAGDDERDRALRRHRRRARPVARSPEAASTSRRSPAP